MRRVVDEDEENECELEDNDEDEEKLVEDMKKRIIKYDKLTKKMFKLLYLITLNTMLKCMTLK
jgi:hypothetical protein